MPSTPPSPWSSYAKAGVATLFWGLSFVALRIALRHAHPFGVVWMRNAIAAVALLALLALRGGRILPQREDLARCTLLGAIFGVHLLIQTFALQHTTSIRAGWIVAFIPAVVALASALFLRQPLAPAGWLGILLATSGVWALTTVQLHELAQARWGDLLMLLSTCTWAAYTLLSVGPMRRSGPLSTTAFSMAVAIVPNALAAAATGTWRSAPTAETWLALAFLGLGSGAIALWAFNRAVSEIGPERGAAFQYFQPFVTLAGSWALLHEPIGSGLFLGAPLVLLGVALIQRAKRQAMRAIQAREQSPA